MACLPESGTPPGWCVARRGWLNAYGSVLGAESASVINAQRLNVRWIILCGPVLLAVSVSWRTLLCVNNWYEVVDGENSTLAMFW